MALNTATSKPVKWSYYFSEKANEILHNENLTPQSIHPAVFTILFKISNGPTPIDNKEVEPYYEGSSDLFRLQIDESFELFYKVIEEEKKFIVLGITRFN